MKVQDWLWPARIPSVGELQDTAREDLCAWREKVNSQLSRTQQLTGAHLLFVKIKCRCLIINQLICKIGIIAEGGRGERIVPLE